MPFLYFVFFVLHLLRVEQAHRNHEAYFITAWASFLIYSLGFWLPTMIRRTWPSVLVVCLIQAAILGNSFAKGALHPSPNHPVIAFIAIQQKNPGITFLAYGYIGVALAIGMFILCLFFPTPKEKEGQEKDRENMQRIHAQEMARIETD